MSDMPPDFGKLMSAPADTFKEPPLLPAGSYLGKQVKHEYGKTNEKQTPYVRFYIQVLSAMEDVDPAMLEGIDLAKRTPMRMDFYVTPDAAFRLKDYIASHGINVEGRSFNELIPETADRMVIIHVTQRPGTGRNAGKSFNDISQISGKPE